MFLERSLRASSLSSLGIDRRIDSALKQLFCTAACGVIGAYQRANKDEGLIRNSPELKLTMTILTGQPSTSQWVKDQINRSLENNMSFPQILGIMGAALDFISDSEFTIVNPDGESYDLANPDKVEINGGQIIVNFEQLPHVCINLTEGKSSIDIEQISLNRGLGLLGQGLVRLIKSVIIYFAKKGDPRVGPNETVVSEWIEGPFWDRQKYIEVEIAENKITYDQWGNKRIEPHVIKQEVRVEFKGSYRRPETIIRGEPPRFW